MKDLEIFTRYILGQRDFRPGYRSSSECDKHNQKHFDNLEYDNEGNPIFKEGMHEYPSHSRFDMSFSTHTSLPTDPILGLSHEYIDNGIYGNKMVILIFHKGSYSVRMVGFDKHNDHIIINYDGGGGTVDIIMRIIQECGRKEKIKEKLREIKLEILIEE